MEQNNRSFPTPNLHLAYTYPTPSENESKIAPTPTPICIYGVGGRLDMRGVLGRKSSYTQEVIR